MAPGKCSRRAVYTIIYVYIYCLERLNTAISHSRISLKIFSMAAPAITNLSSELEVCPTEATSSELGVCPTEATSSELEVRPRGATSFALKLSESAQREARGNPQHVIAPILDRALKGSGEGVRVELLLTPDLVATVAALVERAQCMDFDYKPTDFEAWYDVQVPTRASEAPAVLRLQQQAHKPNKCNAVDELVRRLNGPGFPEVESAHTLYAVPLAAPAFSAPVTPDPRQGYLDAYPTGIDAYYAWDNGGDGTGVDFVDMELGWNPVHENLPQPPLQLIGGIPDPGSDLQTHNMNVLGVVLMQGQNGEGLGVAPNATGSVISGHMLNVGTVRYMNAIIKAISMMKFGDVLLLEAQTNNGVSLGWPVEIQASTYDAIRLATAIGIVVVEATGDGMANFDAPPPSGGSVLGTGPLDSGAIMVGAASSQLTAGVRTLTADSTATQGNQGSCYGSRVDLFAWGDHVYTTTPPSGSYTYTFNGTSSAAAIIAGAALIVQSLAANLYPANPDYRFSPHEVRQFLVNSGSTANAPNNGNLVGVMPNLRAIIDSNLKLTPNLYIRDHFNDDGTRPLKDCTTESPDIIVRQQADPPTMFDGEITDGTLWSQGVNYGNENWIYVRLLNSGGEAATSVSVDVYWSPAATIPTQDTMNYINTTTTQQGTVQNQNVLTVTNAIAWPWPQDPDPVPDDTNICFIAVAGTPQDPAPAFSDSLEPSPTDPSTLSPDPLGTATTAELDTNFINFVERNGTVAVNNLNSVQILASDTADQLRTYRFRVPRTSAATQKHALESLGGLPRAADVRLRLPLELARQLRVPLREGVCQDQEDCVEIPLLPHTRYRIGEGVLASAVDALCELRVRLPKGACVGRGRYEFAVRQTVDGREAGRLAWRFTEQAAPEQTCYEQTYPERTYPETGVSGTDVPGTEVPATDVPKY
jgi:serine protease